MRSLLFIVTCFVAPAQVPDDFIGPIPSQFIVETFSDRAKLDKYLEDHVSCDLYEARKLDYEIQHEPKEDEDNNSYEQVTGINITPSQDDDVQ